MNTAMNKNCPTYHDSGFTLVEMLIVVALIGLLVGMSIPSFIRIGRVAKVSNAANRVYTGLLSARTSAMRKQRPVIIKVTVTAGATANLVFQACLDSNYAITPGADDPTAPGCTTDTPMSGSDNPFFPGQTLTLNNSVITTDNVFLGYPALTTSVFTPLATNLAGASPGIANTYWFGFDSSGKLIPNGQAPFLTQDVTALPHNPVTALSNPGGPEFYFAEINAPNNNTRPSGHVYRKVEITNLGGIRNQSWRNNAWTGVQ